MLRTMGVSVRVGAIRLRELLVIVFVVSLVVAVLLPLLDAARRRKKTRDCTNNLRQLATYMVMYASGPGV